MPKLKTYTPPSPAPPLDPALARKAVTVLEASEIMSIGVTNTRALIASGKLGVIRVGAAGRGIVIPLAALDEFLAQATEKIKQ